MMPEAKIRAFVVDDERLAIDRLQRLLETTGRVAVVGAATDPETALERIGELAIDVLFLDIQMPEMSGFELASRLSKNVPIVFTTAYDEHALEAFAVNSLDYLLKPIEPARLERALDKVQRFAGQSSPPDVRAFARELAAHLTPGRNLERIASRMGERTIILDVACVSHVVAKDKLTFAALGGRDHVVDYTLTQLEERLDPRRFVRVHRAAIVNVAFVVELYPDVGAGIVVRLKDERKTQIGVARDRVKSLKQRLGI